MFQRMTSLACLAMAIGLSGCATPRIVQANSNAVIVAVPEASNTWPTNYQDEACTAAKKYITDPMLVSTTQVKVGETVTNNQSTDRHDIGTNKQKVAEVTTKTNTTSVKDQYEYYLEYRPRYGTTIQQAAGAYTPSGNVNR